MTSRSAIMTESSRPSHPPWATGGRIVAVACLLLAAAIARAQEMQVIDLHYRSAEQVIPVLEPLLDPGDALTGMDGKLFLRAGPATQARVRQALDAIDRKPRQLVITVGQGTVRDISATDVQGSATVNTGNVSVGVNAPPVGETSARVAARDRQQQADLRNVSSVPVLEGTEAYVSIGQSVPYRTTTVTPGWDRPVVQQSTAFRDVGTGFYATPRVNGETVMLTISSRQQSYDPAQGGTVRAAGSDTVVTTRLGEWVQVGAVSETGSGSDNGLLVWGRHSSQFRYSAWLKVDENPR